MTSGTDGGDEAPRHDTARVRATVNGHPFDSEVPTWLSLAGYLRDELGLTGTKVSCGVQVCGACTVLVDRLPVSACVYLAADVDGCEVTTIEGVADGDELHPVQQAFVECSAFQCGYCTPGLVLAAIALLDDVPSPDRAVVARELEGSICRCTGYLPIIDAVLMAAERMQAGGRSAGTREPPVEGGAMLRGKIRSVAESAIQDGYQE